MSKQKKIEPRIRDRLTAVLQLLAAVALTAQIPYVSTPLLLATMILARISSARTDYRSRTPPDRSEFGPLATTFAVSGFPYRFDAKFPPDGCERRTPVPEPPLQCADRQQATRTQTAGTPIV